MGGWAYRKLTGPFRLRQVDVSYAGNNAAGAMNGGAMNGGAMNGGAGTDADPVDRG